MNWAEICANPELRDLPYKIQTDQWGHIVMSPATNEHGMYQAKIVALLSRILKSGAIITECAVQTRSGVKVADVAWASDPFISRNRGKNPFQEAPEICIEILSPSNTVLEMNEKQELYFARGTKEFWMCDQTGSITFHKNTGQIDQSEIARKFPRRILIQPTQ